MSNAPALKSRTITEAWDYFEDGSSLHLLEQNLESILTRDTARTNLDEEYEYVVVGMHWSDPTSGLVRLPEFLTRYEEKAEDELQERRDSYYSRVEHIDNAIGMLQKARALLVAGSSEV